MKVSDFFVKACIAALVLIVLFWGGAILLESDGRNAAATALATPFYLFASLGALALLAAIVAGIWGKFYPPPSN
jgi:hypothetical protein